DSDIDLLVIVDDDTPPEKLALRAGYEARRSYRGAVDVIPCRDQTFRLKRRIAGTLPYEAARDGIKASIRRQEAARWLTIAREGMPCCRHVSAHGAASDW